MPKENTCDGRNVNPPLAFSEVPQGTKSLVLIMDDVDAPMGIFTHWVVFNIPAGMMEVEEDTKPGVMGKNSFGQVGYGGPCPPSGSHRYYFRLYALDTELALSPGSERERVEAAMKERILETAEMMGRYEKKK